MASFRRFQRTLPLFVSRNPNLDSAICTAARAASMVISDASCSGLSAMIAANSSTQTRSCSSSRRIQRKAGRWAKRVRGTMLSQSGLCHNKKVGLMSNQTALDRDRETESPSETTPESGSFGDILQQYEQAHSHKP